MNGRAYGASGGRGPLGLGRAAVGGLNWTVLEDGELGPAEKVP